jgi:hypothetical protein
MPIQMPMEVVGMLCPIGTSSRARDFCFQSSFAEDTSAEHTTRICIYCAEKLIEKLSNAAPLWTDHL